MQTRCRDERSKKHISISAPETQWSLPNREVKDQPSVTETITRTVKEKTISLQLIDNFFQVIGLDLSGHDFHHLLANLPNLLMLGIGSLADLVITLLRKAHTEEAQ